MLKRGKLQLQTPCTMKSKYQGCGDPKIAHSKGYLGMRALAAEWLAAAISDAAL